MQMRYGKQLVMIYRSYLLLLMNESPVSHNMIVHLYSVLLPIYLARYSILPHGPHIEILWRNFMDQPGLTSYFVLDHHVSNH